MLNERGEIRIEINSIQRIIGDVIRTPKDRRSLEFNPNILQLAAHLIHKISQCKQSSQWYVILSFLIRYNQLPFVAFGKCN